MASPTWAEVWTQIGHLTKILDITLANGATAATNVVGRLDSHAQAVEGDFAPQAAAEGLKWRNDYARLIASSRIRRLLDPHLFDLAKVINSPATEINRLLIDIRQYMVDNTLSVVRRNITFAAVVAAGGNVGNGTIYRLTIDEDNQNIEAVHVGETMTLKCVQDANTGQERGRESFELYHGDVGPDELEIRGSTLIGSAQAIVGDTILKNASFGTLDGTIAAPTTIPNWDFLTGTVANVTLSEAATFRQAPEETTARSLAINAAANIEIRQKLATIGFDLDPNVPYLLGCRWNTLGSGRTGTLTIAFGATTKVYTFTGAEATGWNTIVLDRNRLLWPDQAKEDDLDIRIAAAGAGAGTLNIDDVFFAPATIFDNLAYWPVGGATAFLRDDKFTFADALAASDSVNQKWLWRGYNFWFPSASSTAATIADP